MKKVLFSAGSWNFSESLPLRENFEVLQKLSSFRQISKFSSFSKTRLNQTLQLNRLKKIYKKTPQKSAKNFSMEIEIILYIN